MSVEIILSSKQIELDSYNQATLNIKAVFPALPCDISCLYKIRTNSKDAVDARPSFGLLTSKGGDNSIGSMNIRYLGRVESIKKMKLQISWVWGEGIPEKKLTHSQFSQLYANLRQKIGKQKSHMLQFTTKLEAKQTQDSLIIKDEHKNNPTTQKQQHLEQEKELQQINDQAPIQPKLSSQVKQKRYLSWKLLVLGVVVAFLVGMLLGMKIEKEAAVLKEEKYIHLIEQIFPWQKSSILPESQEDIPQETDKDRLQDFGSKQVASASNASAPENIPNQEPQI